MSLTEIEEWDIDELFRWLAVIEVLVGGKKGDGSIDMEMLGDFRDAMRKSLAEKRRKEELFERFFGSN